MVGAREDFDLFTHFTPSSKNPGPAVTGPHLHETHPVFISLWGSVTADE